jgi:hypothetical protein
MGAEQRVAYERPGECGAIVEQRNPARAELREVFDEYQRLFWHTEERRAHAPQDEVDALLDKLQGVANRKYALMLRAGL